MVFTLENSLICLFLHSTSRHFLSSSLSNFPKSFRVGWGWGRQSPGDYASLSRSSMSIREWCISPMENLHIQERLWNSKPYNKLVFSSQQEIRGGSMVSRYNQKFSWVFCMEFQFLPFLYCQNGPKKQQSGNWQKIHWMVQNAQFNSRFQYFWEILGVYIQVVWFPEELV